jgi:chaperone required for assembly of F1-ATPase
MKRFWKEAAFRPADGGFAILLDGRPVRTPARAPLTVPSEALAEAMRREWSAQDEHLEPRTMPLTGLANAAIDHAASDPTAFAAMLTPYAGSDLLCYRDDRDAALAAQQAAAWNPLLGWAEARFGIEFVIGTGVLPFPQAPATLAALTAHVAALPPFRLAGLSPLVTIGGSLVAALAVDEGARDAAELWPIICLDEIYQESRWGSDAQATAARQARERDWLSAARFLALL